MFLTALELTIVDDFIVGRRCLIERSRDAKK